MSSSDRPKVYLGEPEVITADEFLRIVEEEEAAERAEVLAKFGHAGQRLTITIPRSIGAVERGDRFEDPLQDALGDRGIVHGGGSCSRENAEGLSIVEVDIGLTVADLDEALPVLRACLHAQGAPPNTTIRAPDDREYRLGELPSG